MKPVIYQLQEKLRDVTIKSLNLWVGKDISEQLLEKNLFGAFELKITEKKFGDVSCNLVLRLAKILKRNPKELGQLLMGEWNSLPEIKAVSFVMPGFLNLVISDEFKTSYFKELMGCGVGSFAGLTLDDSKKKKIILEYVSANPTGPLHIGHGRWAVIGSILSNLFKAVGHDVEEEFYINDMGTQIDKLNQSVDEVRRGVAVSEDGYHGEYIKDLVDCDLPGGLNEPKNKLLADQKRVLLNLRVKHDYFVSESKIREKEKVASVIELLESKGFIYEKEGAVWFRSTDKGDDKDRVLIRSDKTYTYFAVDIAYHYYKINRKPDVLINILGADHHGYIKRVAAAVDILSDGKIKLDMVIGQLVLLLRGGVPVPFSKRTGNIIEVSEVMEEIGVNALRYFMSMRSMQSNLEFDLAVAKENSLENPIYYIQYANARVCSVLQKGRDVEVTPCSAENFNYSSIANEFTNEIFKKLVFFENEILKMAESYQVHHLNTYLYELASLFHRLYNEEKFIQTGEEFNREKSEQYLFFLTAIQKVFHKCFELLGITPMEKM